MQWIGSVDATAAPKVISTLASSFAIDICAGEDHALAIAGKFSNC